MFDINIKSLNWFKLWIFYKIEYLSFALTFSLNTLHIKHIYHNNKNLRYISMIKKTDSSLLNWIYKHVVDFTLEDDTSGLSWESTNKEALSFINCIPKNTEYMLLEAICLQ